MQSKKAMLFYTYVMEFRKDFASFVVKSVCYRHPRKSQRYLIAIWITNGQYRERARAGA